VPVGSGPVVVQPAQPGGVIVQPPSNGTRPTLVQPADQQQWSNGVSRHYQLVALEFDVLHQTFDDMLERDGAGDEIQIRTTALNLDGDGKFVSDVSSRSGSFGAPDHNDFAAGTAEPGFSAEQRIGGLKTGDIYPPRERDLQHNGDLPMVIWDGTLEMARNGVIIVPTVWELDYSGTGAAGSWGRMLVDLAQHNQPKIQETLSTLAQPGASYVSEDLFQQVDLTITGDRPIATTAQQPPLVTIFDILLPVIVQRPEILNPKMAMKVPAIALNFARAEDLSSRSPRTITVHSQDGTVNFTRQLPKGAFAVRYTDPPGMDGDYLLILQLVRD
jgi:hypothetical protein